jgi:hypothetical protein
MSSGDSGKPCGQIVNRFGGHTFVEPGGKTEKRKTNKMRGENQTKYRGERIVPVA